MILATLLAIGCGGGKTKRQLGACVVGYEGLTGTRDTACMFPAEKRECDDPDHLPPIFPSGGTADIAKHVFIPDRSCDALGYTTHGCEDVAIAWSFKNACP